MSKATTAIVSLLIVACFCAFPPEWVSAGGGTTPTTTTLSIAPDSFVDAGTAVSLTATVTGAAAGTVLFCEATAARCDGAAVLGAAQVTSAHTAEFKFMPGAGTYSIEAEFLGFTGTGPSASAAQALTVTGLSNYASLSSIAESGSVGNYTLTGTVTAFGKATATGTVSFVDTSDGNAVVGAAALNPASLDTFFGPSPDSPLSPKQGVRFVATGDFNNDGIPDLALITKNDGPNYVGIALGNGDGTFQDPVNYSVGSEPTMVAVADVNGDGKLDLIAPDVSNNVVNILLGNGDGTFQAAVGYGTGNDPNFVAVGDFNGDGIPDLAVTNPGDSTVSILLGAGGGTFATEVPYAVGSNPVGVVAGDFNNDGKLDLAVSNNAGASLSILLGTGNGVLAAQTVISLSVGAQPYWLATGDLRGNGTLDLVVPDSHSSNVYVLLGNNTGTFPDLVAYPVASNPQAVSLGDVNGDGILDIVSANYALGNGFGNTVSVLIGAGTGTFGTQTPYGVGLGPTNVALADYNGDGVLDLADSDNVDGTATILLQAHTETGIATGVSAPLSGTQNVLASYPGDADRAPSESPTVPLTGGSTLTTSTTTLTITPDPAAFGQAVTLTATISPVPGSLFGTVTFYEGGTVLAVANVNASGIATFTINSLTAGLHAITAQYSGNAGLFGSISNSTRERILPAATSTTTLALSAASVPAGRATTLTASVLSGVTPVTSGVVTFCNTNITPCEDMAVLGTAELTANGTAALDLTFGVGVYSIDAVFAGSNTVQGSTSPAQVLTVTGIASYASTTTIGSAGSVGNYSLTGTVSAFGSVLLSGNLSFLNTSDSNAVVATAAFNPATRAYGVTPASGSPLAEANGPTNAVAGDFNGDGILDFAVVDNTIATVSIFLGNGDGTFKAAVTYPTGGYGLDLKVSDFNGDGKLDLVTANAYGDSGPGNTVSVLLGNGDGTFRPQVAYAAGVAPYGVAVGDFNGDGILDLAVASNGTNTVNILLGNGDGTFQPQVEYASGNGPFFVAAGDFNGDGILDLAVLSSATVSTVSVLLGNGDGTFETQVIYPVGSGASYNDDYLVTADVNNDGRLDLITANYSDNTVSVLLGNGNGTFQAQVAYPTGAGPSDIAVADFNQDGNLDLAITNNSFGSGTTLGILYGNGDGTFNPQVAATVGSGPWGIAAGDFNGDGLTDLVAANNSTNTVSVLLNQQSESATATGVAVFGTGTQNVLVSYPGDASRSASVSNTIALTGTPPTATATTFTAAPNPAFAGQPVTLTATVAPAPTGSALGTVSFYRGATVLGTATVNSSGIATFIGSLPVGALSVTAVYSGNLGFVTSTSSPQVVNVSVDQSSTTTLRIAPGSSVAAGTAVTLTATVIANTGDITFALPQGTVMFCDATATRCEGPAVFGSAQLTSAGTAVIELTLGVGSYSIHAVFQPRVGIPSSTSGPQPLTVTGTASYLSSTTIAATGAPANYTLTGTVTAFGTLAPTGTLSFLNVSNGNASLGGAALDPATLAEVFIPASGAPLSVPSTEYVVSGDFNHDGIPDLAVLSETSSGTVGVFLGRGDGSFQAVANYGVGTNPVMIAVSDVNGDGNLDLIVPNNGDATVSVLLGNSNGTFQAATTSAVGNGPEFAAVGDLNQDGVPDLAVTNLADGTVSILLGVGDGTFPTQVTYFVPNPIGVAVGDFNHDGTPDLAVSGTVQGNIVAVLQGNGDGTFTQPNPFITIPANIDAYWLAAGDLRKNGTVDLVVPDRAGSNVYVLLGNNDGTFQTAVAYAVGQDPLAVSLGDVNGDSVLDLVVPDTAEDGLVSVLLGNGDGTFAAKTDYSVGNNPINVALADFNGDGLLDMATADYGSSTATVLLGARTETATITGVTQFGAGTYNVLASYPGDASRAASVSNPVPLTEVPQTVTVTTLTVVPNPAVTGQLVTLTATVAPAPTGAPLGTVSFYNGTTLLGMGTVNSSGIATFTTSSLPAGTLSITAVYSGDGGFSSSTSTALTETVTAATVITTTTTLTVSPNPLFDGQPATLTATVAPAPTGSPTGTVSFYSGTTLLGTGTVNASGVATLILSNLVVGDASITAVYSGNAGYAASTSTAVNETVTPSYTVTGPTTPIQVAPGGSVNLNITVPPLGGAFNSMVTLSASGLPAGATAAFNPPTVTPGSTGATTVMTIQLAVVAAGNLVHDSPVRDIPGTHGGLPAGPFRLVFGVFGTVFGAVLGRRRLSRRLIRLVLLAGLGVTASFITSCGGGFGNTTPAGNYTITVTGTSGSFQASTTVMLAVK